MEISVKIKSVKARYRASTKEWCLDVNAWTDNVSLALTYTGKTLNQARKWILKFLPEDLMREEVAFRFRELLQMTECEE